MSVVSGFVSSLRLCVSAVNMSFRCYNLFSRGNEGTRTASRAANQIHGGAHALLPRLLYPADRAQVQAFLPEMRLLHELRRLLLSPKTHV